MITDIGRRVVQWTVGGGSFGALVGAVAATALEGFEAMMAGAVAGGAVGAPLGLWIIAAVADSD